jgi:hypothetical protein
MKTCKCDFGSHIVLSSLNTVPTHFYSLPCLELLLAVKLYYNVWKCSSLKLMIMIPAWSIGNIQTKTTIKSHVIMLLFYCTLVELTITFTTMDDNVSVEIKQYSLRDHIDSNNLWKSELWFTASFFQPTATSSPATSSTSLSSVMYFYIVWNTFLFS